VAVTRVDRGLRDLPGWLGRGRGEQRRAAGVRLAAPDHSQINGWVRGAADDGVPRAEPPIMG
jgi:hypothetical protein